jgi:hypothetical protein
MKCTDWGSEFPIQLLISAPAGSMRLIIREGLIKTKAGTHKQVTTPMDATTAGWKNMIQDNSKSIPPAAPIQDQLANVISCWDSLDLEVTEEFMFEDLCSHNSSDICGRNVESKLPPPMPFFDRRAHTPAHAYTPAHAPLLMQSVFSRVSSSPTMHVCGSPTGNELLQTKGMSQSMSNLHSSRSLYNRGIGYSVLSCATECGDKQGRNSMHARVQEFEALLENL